MFGVSDHEIDYKNIPGCTYTHPQVASMGYTEKRAREAGGEIRIGKFPFGATSTSLASKSVSTAEDWAKSSRLTGPVISVSCAKAGVV